MIELTVSVDVVDPPTTIVIGAIAPSEKSVTVSDDVPKLVAWSESPAYVAVIATALAGAVDAAVYVTPHELCVVVAATGANMQDAELNVPPATLALHVTVPPGLTAIAMQQAGALLVSVTVTEYVTGPAAITVAVVGVMLVDVVLELAANVFVAELVECVASPE